MSEEEISVYKNNIAKMLEETNKDNNYFILTNSDNYYCIFNLLNSKNYHKMIERVISILKKDNWEITSISINDNDTIYFWVSRNYYERRFVFRSIKDLVVEIYN